MTSARLLLLPLAAAALLGIGGCSGGDNDWFHLADGGWTSLDKLPDGRPGASRDLGPAPDGLPSSAGGPVIRILSPAAASTVIDPSLKVIATITDREGVDPTSVTATIQGEKPVKMSVTPQPDRYEALLDVSKLGGPLRLWVIAADLTGSKSSAVVTFRRDPGAAVNFLSPLEGGHYKGSVLLKVMVEDPAPRSFDVQVGTDKLTLGKSSLSTGRWVYTGVLTFDDPFDPPLSGTQVLTATAVSQSGATTIVQRTFVVDDVGPSITILSHKEGQIVGGTEKLQARISDPAGVLASSVRCVIGAGGGSNTVTLKAVPGSADTYQGIFDTRTFTSNDLWPVLSFRAADTLGNESHLDIQVGLDNAPPTIELDPATLAHAGRFKDGLLQCSHPFDPVGAEAINDMALAPQITVVRSLVEDQGNTSPSAKFVPISQIDEQTVWLYVLDDTSRPLVVDSDGDGFCDSISPQVVPLSSAAQTGKAIAVNLKGVPKGGKGDYRPLTDLPFPICASGAEQVPPDPLCFTTKLTIALTYTSSGQPSLWAIPPIVPSDKVACLGLPFDFGANKITDGWACAAVSARDNAGNQGVSPPLRLFVDKAAVQAGPAPSSAGSPPECTGTLDPATGTVSSKPCVFRGWAASAPQRFPAQRLYLE